MNALFFKKPDYFHKKPCCVNTSSPNVSKNNTFKLRKLKIFLIHEKNAWVFYFFQENPRLIKTFSITNAMKIKTMIQELTGGILIYFFSHYQSSSSLPAGNLWDQIGLLLCGTYINVISLIKINCLLEEK